MSNIKRKKDQCPRDENIKAHGEWIVHWDNGQLWYRCTYIHGVAHGFYESYYADSRLANRGYLNMGRRVGYWFIGRNVGYWVVKFKKNYYLCLI